MTKNIEELRAKAKKEPIASFLGMKLVELSKGYAKVKLELKKEFLNWENMIHGGVIATLLDQAFGCACNTSYDESISRSRSPGFNSYLPGLTTCPSR